MTELSRDEVIKLWDLATLETANGVDAMQYFAAAIYEAGAKSEQTWFDGYPTKFRAEEWFIAITTYGDRVVLRALPEEYSYDFKTADETYIMRDKIAKWMPFPDSEYISPAAKLLKSERAVSDRLLEALKFWKIAADNAEECEFDEMAAFSVPMPLFCDADEATDAAIAEVEAMRKEKPE